VVTQARSSSDKRKLLIKASLLAFWPQIGALAIGWAVAGPAAGLLAFVGIYMVTIFGIGIFGVRQIRRERANER
jgi:uncharacterized membrane protein (Fun14 family)